MEKTITFYCWLPLFTVSFLSRWNTAWFEAGGISLFNLSEFDVW